MNLETIYLRLPIWLQNKVCGLQGARIQRQRYSAEFWELLRAAEDRSSWSARELEAFRNRRLQEFLLHCQATVPYYRDQWAVLGFDPRQVESLDDLAVLPILDKDTVRANYERLLSTSVPVNQRITAHTSGSTGAGLRFATTLAAQREQWAIWWRFRRWHGIELDTWCAYFGGRSVVPLAQQSPPFFRVNSPGRQYLWSGYHLSRKNAPEYLAGLNRQQAPWLHGYPSLLTLLAQELLERGKRLDYPVRWVSCGAENLLESQSAIIAAAFGVRPIQHYGMSEAVGNISQDPAGRLVVDEDFAALEFVPQPHLAAGMASLVGTNLSNAALPLVRYQVGDIATVCESSTPPPAEQPRPSLAGRMVSQIDGRLEDCLVLKNGARLGRMDHVFKDLTTIKEAQIYQEVPGEFVIRLVKAAGYLPRDEQQLSAEMRQRVGSETMFRIEYHDQLERTATGKLRFVISRIAGSVTVRDHGHKMD